MWTTELHDVLPGRAAAVVDVVEVPVVAACAGAPPVVALRVVALWLPPLPAVALALPWVGPLGVPAFPARFACFTGEASVDGKTYIGPGPDPGTNDDREVVSFSNQVLVLRWIDPEVAGRYGTGVYVRCTGRA